MSNSHSSNQLPSTFVSEYEPLLNAAQQVLSELQGTSSNICTNIDLTESLVEPDKTESSHDTTIGAIHNLIDLICSPSRASVERVRDLVKPKARKQLSTDSPNQGQGSTNDPDLSQAFQCPICFESYLKNEPISTECGHIFCKDCISQCIFSMNKCPVCMKPATFKNIFRIFL